MQKELCLQEEKLDKIHQKYDEEIIKKQHLEEKCKVIKQNFEKVDEKLQKQRKNGDFKNLFTLFYLIQLCFCM